MAYAKGKDRPNKLAAQSTVEEYLRGSRVIITLPAEECLGLKRWIRDDKIPSDAFIIAAEYKKEFIPAIKSFLEKHFPNRHHLHQGDICEMDLKAVTAKSGKIDFADFDFCGPMTASIARWMGKFKGCFNDGAKIFWTLMYDRQGVGNHLLAHCAKNDLLSSVKFPDFQNVKWTSVQKFSYGMTSLCTPFRLKPLMGKTYSDTGANMFVIGFKIEGNRNPDYSKLLPKPKVGTAEWQKIKCPASMTSGKKAAAVLSAKRGIRPGWITPSRWAWNPLNPNGIRRKSQSASH